MSDEFIRDGDNSADFAEENHDNTTRTSWRSHDKARESTVLKMDEGINRRQMRTSRVMLRGRLMVV